MTAQEGTSDGLLCRQVSKDFGGGKGIFDVTLSVSPKTIYALLGHNGAGKTTLMNASLGFVAVDRGEIWVNGVHIASDPVSAKLHLAYVPEVARLYGHLSAVENLAFFERLMGRNPVGSTLVDVLDRLRFPSSAMRQPAQTYSKGMRQKAVLALGLLKGAKVFLLDEPTSGLDPEAAKDLVAIMRRLRDAGKAILFSSHDLHTVEACADMIGWMHGGRIVIEESGETFRYPDLAQLEALRNAQV